MMKLMSADRIRIQDRDLALLTGLFESRLMTCDHVSRLYFEGRGEAAKKRLQKLRSAGYVSQRRPGGFEKAVYHVTAMGTNLIREYGSLPEYLRHFDRPSGHSTTGNDATTRHDLDVLDVKIAFTAALNGADRLKLKEFIIWPDLVQFRVAGITVKPDGFARIMEFRPDGSATEHCFFLELDRSTETQDALVVRAAAYRDFFKSGGFAARCGASRSAYKAHPFRVLFVMKSPERIINTARRLFANEPPILTLAWLSTLDAVKADPLGDVWIRPVDCRDAERRLADEAAAMTFNHRGVQIPRRNVDRHDLIKSHPIFPDRNADY